MPSEYAAQLSALRQLVSYRATGGFELPQQVVDALQAHDALRTQTPAPPARIDVETAGARLAETVLNGEPADVHALAREVHEAEVDQDIARIASRVQAEAVERLAGGAVAALRDNSDIVFEALSTAFTETLDTARAAVKAMGGIDVIPEVAMRAGKTDEYLALTRRRPPLAGNLRGPRKDHASNGRRAAARQQLRLRHPEAPPAFGARLGAPATPATPRMARTRRQHRQAFAAHTRRCGRRAMDAFTSTARSSLGRRLARSLREDGRQPQLHARRRRIHRRSPTLTKFSHRDGRRTLPPRVVLRLRRQGEASNGGPMGSRRSTPSRWGTPPGDHHPAPVAFVVDLRRHAQLGNSLRLTSHGDRDRTETKRHIGALLPFVRRRVRCRLHRVSVRVGAGSS